jgi:hypothetical protein
MSDLHFLVLSSPPDGVSVEEYDAWYATHVAEVLERVPEFVAAERCHLQPQAGDAIPYRFMTRYTIEGEFDAAWRGLRAAVDSGELTFEDWYGGVVASGSVCTTVARAGR